MLRFNQSQNLPYVGVFAKIHVFSRKLYVIPVGDNTNGQQRKKWSPWACRRVTQVKKWSPWACRRVTQVKKWSPWACQRVTQVKKWSP